MKISKKNILSIAALAAVFIVIGLLNFIPTQKVETKPTYIAEVFKSPSCGCCIGYISALENNGFQVKSTDMEDLNSVKIRYNIPVKMQSCHTTIIGKYFIEGHVPIDAVIKLLKDQPDIDGIALPGMPIGTPGMPGPKESPFIIYQIHQGKYSEFMRI